MIKTKNSAGITLIELLVVMGISLILGGGVLGLQYILAQNQQLAIDSYYNVDTANINLNTMTREIRTARVSATGSYPIATADDNEIIFYSDIDFDNVVERVRYTRNDNELEKGIVKPSGQPASYVISNEIVKLLTEDIRNDDLPIFTYFNGDWPIDIINNPLSSPPVLSDIKLVRIYLKVNQSSDPTSEDFILDSYTTFRMLKDNL
ncbi:prepilin-type N-terminal cleavage/methylation domain-containing protein [Candidatus Woesebacteria bacterium]|nr:MAG: prepilin-type N-terminal cleavage/methylation domain-containing protein [Candidatus Woesebacteria bacterium]